MTQSDRQRARRDRAEGRTATQRAQRDRERRAELLVAEVLSVLSQRDVLVAGLERRAGRCLVEIHALGWLGSGLTASACDLSLREATRLRELVNEGDAAPPNRERPPEADDGPAVGRKG